MAVEDWLGKKGDAVDENDEVIPLKSCSHVVNMPFKTMHKHVALIKSNDVNLANQWEGNLFLMPLTGNLQLMSFDVPTEVTRA